MTKGSSNFMGAHRHSGVGDAFSLSGDLARPRSQCHVTVWVEAHLGKLTSSEI